MPAPSHRNGEPVNRLFARLIVATVATLTAAAGGESPEQRCQQKYDALLAEYQARNDTDLKRTIEDLRRRAYQSNEAMEEIIAKAENLMVEKLKMHKKIARMEFQTCVRKLTAVNKTDSK